MCEYSSIFTLDKSLLYTTVTIGQLTGRTPRLSSFKLVAIQTEARRAHQAAELDMAPVEDNQFSLEEGMLP